MAAVKPKRPPSPPNALRKKPSNPSSRKGRAALKAKWEPQRYSEAMALKILAQLRGDEGDPMSLRAICAAEGMPSEMTVRRWVTEDRDGFAARYAEARDYAIDHMAADIIEISDAATPDTVQVAKLKAESRKWYVGKLAPKRYGDRLQLDADVTLRFADLDDAALNARIAGLLALLPKAT